MRRKRTVKSREFYVLSDQGPSDAELHEPVLAAGDEAAARAIGKKAAKRTGLTDEEIDLLYPEN